MRLVPLIQLRTAPRWVRSAAAIVGLLCLIAAGLTASLGETPYYGEYETRGRLMVRGWCAEGRMIRPPPAAACDRGEDGVSYQSDWDAYAEQVHRSGQATVAGLPLGTALSLLFTLLAIGSFAGGWMSTRTRRFRFDGDITFLDGRAVWNDDIRSARVRGLLVPYLHIETDDFDLTIGPLLGTAWEAEVLAQQLTEAIPMERRLPWS